MPESAVLVAVVAVLVWLSTLERNPVEDNAGNRDKDGHGK